MKILLLIAWIVASIMGLCVIISDMKKKNQSKANM